MYVTDHAERQLRERCTLAEFHDIMNTLEARKGTPGLVGVLVTRLQEQRCMGCGHHRGYHADDCDMPSNGNLVVAIVEDASVLTIMYRRSSQPLTNAALGVHSIEDWSTE